MTSNPLPSKIKNYLNDRGISDEVLKKANIGWDGARIVIPVNGEFNKYRRSPFSETGPKYSYEAGATSALFNLASLKENGTIVITEGEFDALCLESAGIHAVSSTGGSATFEPEWAPLFDKKEVFICYDNDEPGIRGAVRVQAIIPHAKIIQLPRKDGVKDATDFFMKTDRAVNKFILLMSEARSYSLPVEDTEHPSKSLKDFKIALDDLVAEKRRLMNDGKDTYVIESVMDHVCKRIEAFERFAKPKRKFSGSSSDLQKAKSVPLGSILTFNSNGFARCLWHGAGKEKTPSLHWHTKQNIFKCFSCSEFGDSIDLYMKIHACSLKEAVAELIKLA